MTARRIVVVATIIIVTLSALIALSGCKPYDRPEFIEIDTSETGFLIPLEGNTDKQVAFESEHYLNECKVATKRVQIPHRWVQTGRMYWSGACTGRASGSAPCASSRSIVPR